MEDDKHMKCPYCGNMLVWQSDASADEVCEDYIGDDEAIVSWYTCSHCGREFEVFDPMKEQRETTYKDYWK